MTYSHITMATSTTTTNINNAANTNTILIGERRKDE